MLFTSIKNFGALKLTALNKDNAPTTQVRVTWDGEFQEELSVKTKSPIEAVNIVADVLLVNETL